jgi:hypothetical protein
LLYLQSRFRAGIIFDECSRESLYEGLDSIDQRRRCRKTFTCDARTKILIQIKASFDRANLNGPAFDGKRVRDTSDSTRAV